MKTVFAALATAAIALTSFALPTTVVQADPLPYGPDTCINGYVWRDAAPGDHVCVRPNSRSLAQQENRMAHRRVDRYGPYGPNTCVEGFVWREAFGGDVVCVTPARREAVRIENANGRRYRVLG